MTSDYQLLGTDFHYTRQGKRYDVTLKVNMKGHLRWSFNGLEQFYHVKYFDLHKHVERWTGPF